MTKAIKSPKLTELMHEKSPTNVLKAKLAFAKGLFNPNKKADRPQVVLAGKIRRTPFKSEEIVLDKHLDKDAIVIVVDGEMVKNAWGDNSMTVPSKEDKKAYKQYRANLSFKITYFDWLMNGHLTEASINPAEDEKPIIELFKSLGNEEAREKKMEELTAEYYSL